jgi:ankyrin repeat protein
MKKRKFSNQHDLNEHYLHSRNLKEIEELLLQGADINYKSLLGNSKLHLYCFIFPIVQLLILNGIDVNAVNANGDSIIEMLTKCSNIETYYLKEIKYLMYNGADATEALKLFDCKERPKLCRFLKIESIEKVKNLLRKNLYNELCEIVIKFISFD